MTLPIHQVQELYKFIQFESRQVNAQNISSNFLLYILPDPSQTMF